jgi:hypothetical protein
MSINEFRERFRLARFAFDEEARTLKDSYLALQRLAEYFEGLDSQERQLAAIVLSEWLLAEDEALRFDGMALVRKFRISEAIPALGKLNERLRASSSPGAPFECEKVAKLITYLSEQGRVPQLP